MWRIDVWLCSDRGIKAKFYTSQSCPCIGDDTKHGIVAGVMTIDTETKTATVVINE